MRRSENPGTLPKTEHTHFYEDKRDRHSLRRRDLFRLLGGGIVMLVALPVWEEADAQETGGGRRPRGGDLPQEIGAWLHIADNGSVTVYTGKVEVGQNIRTSLSQAVAEELAVSIAAVTLVMGDTDRTPFDMGTFGSRTTPTMAPQLRRAAAAAREQLLDLAAAQWQCERTALTVSDGFVHHPATGRSLGYGPLCKGQKFTQTIPAHTATTPPERWKIAGTSVPKVEGRDFITGRHRYTSDEKREGMLHGKILRPPTFQSKLASLDTNQARKLPGVTVVHEGEFVGVVAPTRWETERALAALRPEWQTPAGPSESNLFAQLRPHPANETAAGQTEKAKALAATYTIAYIAHAPLEPRAAVAEWNGDHLTVWTGTQRPFGVRSDLAGALHLPESQVRVIMPDTGSGYGGKHSGEAALEAARLAKAAGKPVKVVWTRQEEFTWAYFRPAGVIAVSGAVQADGTLSRWEFHNYNSGGSGLPTPYEVTNQNCQFHPAESPLRQGSYRGLAATANHFARESHMDDLAHAVKSDPLAFRLKNLKEARLRAVLEAATERFGWKTKKAAPGHGFGLACGTEKGSYVASCVEVQVDRSRGKVTLKRIVTAFECGAIVNPIHLQNQVEGATVMGIGGALFEAIHFEGGRILNPHFAQYRVPRFSDVPEIEVVLLNRKDLPSAGAGETPIVAIAPAIGNAIFAATGVRLRSLPMVPDGFKE